MENITFTLSEMQRTLISINAYLAAFAEEIENKKKKVDKKKNTHKEKRNVYTKKNDGTIVIDEEFRKSLQEEEIIFYENMARSYPSICENLEALTFREYHVLKNIFGLEKVNLTIDELENFRNITKYKSAYKTIRRWCKR